MMTTWQTLADELAQRAAPAGSRWQAPIAAVPRHLFVPRWWERGPDGWALADGEEDRERWMATAYADRSVITSVAGQHADHAKPDDHPAGWPTSSATLPGLIVQMFQHARINDGQDVLDVGTGSGYGAALAALRLGEQHVTSVDVDPYLVEAARSRLDAIDLHPTLLTADATGPLPVGAYDRIVATVAMPAIPASWLAALRPGGRLVTTITGTSLIITATKQADGSARGRTEWDRAGFMHSRPGAGDYPAGAAGVLAAARDERHGEVEVGSYPVIDITQAWDLVSMLDLELGGGGGLEYDIVPDEERSGVRTVILAHRDGSWARATASGDGLPVVEQGGPRRLWTLLDELRTYALVHGELPVRGAQVRIRPDGTTVLARGGWHAKLPTAGQG